MQNNFVCCSEHNQNLSNSFDRPLVVFKPISFLSRLCCHVQHQMCRRVSSQVISSNVPLSKFGQHCFANRVLLTLLSCASSRHYFTLCFKLNFYSAKGKKIPSSTASFNMKATHYPTLLSSQL